jgi:nucleoside-diphosphate-sugar epimerase
MRVCVTGGCGYIGSVLVPKLLDAGHEVVVLDIQWFGDHLAKHPNLTVMRWDIRDGMAQVFTKIFDTLASLRPETYSTIN